MLIFLFGAFWKTFYSLRYFQNTEINILLININFISSTQNNNWKNAPLNASLERELFVCSSFFFFFLRNSNNNEKTLNNFNINRLKCFCLQCWMTADELSFSSTFREGKKDLMRKVLAYLLQNVCQNGFRIQIERIVIFFLIIFIIVEFRYYRLGNTQCIIFLPWNKLFLAISISMRFTRFTFQI